MVPLSIPCPEPLPSCEIPKPGISAALLVALRADMLRFAHLQLRNRDLAEDLVQEAIEAALRSSSSFAGASSLKSWVFAILRNRIADHFRKESRNVNLSSLAAEGADLDEFLDELFNRQGGWQDELRPAAWPAPDEAMQSKQFWAVLEACLMTLPAQTSRVFMMREILGIEADEICRQLGISAGNCHVILHRARQKLRTCLEAGWGRAETGVRRSAWRSCNPPLAGAIA